MQALQLDHGLVECRAMPPEPRVVPRFAAEPPQEVAPYGRWAERLREEFLAAAAQLEDVGEPGDVAFYPDRTWHGRTFVPATAMTSTGLELFGYVSFRPGGADREPTEFDAVADYTEDTAEANPDWQLDLSDQELATWRGPQTRRGEITLVWGVALTANGAVVTSELGPTTTDQCTIVEDRFTLISLDNYTGDFLEIKLWGAGGGEVAAESLYADEDEE
jgi:hypothetical protein